MPVALGVCLVSSVAFCTRETGRVLWVAAVAVMAAAGLVAAAAAELRGLP
ncbi:hypothetical protein [Streptomyces roseochromogenus]|uniref:Uncharacterized protein n=1 Tax=Streptomyces roseochromogenus subsp. oscitans DS 12.976 TaxID=1352936 RepID=V6JXU3_STRRC|nr:hypothetical protein [Streptomyces roseochromogenus]EST24538.1 hypothetical protein M878_30380 [Streptomyces roseochromogenus subsp. oscitans DS 12.976]